MDALNFTQNSAWAQVPPAPPLPPFYPGQSNWVWGGAKIGRRLGLNPQRTQHWLRKGWIPGARSVAGRWGISEADLQAAIAAKPADRRKRERISPDLRVARRVVKTHAISLQANGPVRRVAPGIFAAVDQNTLSLLTIDAAIEMGFGELVTAPFVLSAVALALTESGREPRQL